MKMKRRTNDSDPAWGYKKKKRKMVSRGSLRLLRSLMYKKRNADRGKVKTVCVTRTVELPSTHKTGEECSKLLFALALGLIPSLPKLDGKTKLQQAGPVVNVERLDPEVEAEAKARTKAILQEIAHRRLADYKRRMERQLEYKQTFTTSLYFNPPSPSDGNEDVECVDLVSSDNESCSNVSDEEFNSANPSIIGGAYSTSLHRRNRTSAFAKACKATGSYKIITSSVHLRKSVFKPLPNNQDSGIFRNWKPESMSRLMNLNKVDTVRGACKTSLKGSQSKLLSSLKSLPKGPNFTVTKFPSDISAGSNCHAAGARSDASSSSSVISELDFIVPDNIITID